MAARVIPWVKLQDSPNIRPTTIDRKRDVEIKQFHNVISK